MSGLMEPAPRKRYPVRSRDSGSVPVPVEVIHNRRLSCDADASCDLARFEAVVIIRNMAKSLFFCGHHFRQYRLALFERGYEVRELLWQR